jgi:hypothetical protein
MSQPPFDPTKAVLFDLAQGLVHIDDAPARVLVPADALLALAAAAGDDAARAFARAIGEPIGVRVARRLSEGQPSGEGTRQSSVDTVVDHLGGELALLGLGSLSLERWGRAMLLVIDQSPLAKGGDLLLAGVLEAALGRATGKPVRCLALMREPARLRFLVAGEAAVSKVRGWLHDGVSWGEALARLHAPEPEHRGAA